MKLEFIPLDKLVVSRTNMRYAKKAPDVSDILPTVRRRGVIQSLVVRPGAAPGLFEILAGARRYHAARIVAEETENPEPLPCAILDAGDDAAAIEASLIENTARRDPDEVTQWESFTRLVREGRKPDDLALTFGMPGAQVRRILALGNLLPRIRSLYRAEKIDAASIRVLTMASKRQQLDWLALVDDPDARAPVGHQLKAWLFGGQPIKAGVALFDAEAAGIAAVADLFGEDRYFTDADAFWTAQNAEIEARRAAYLDAGWREVVLVPPSEHFQAWEYEKTSKRSGGRVYVDVRGSGEVVFHEGYLGRKEAEAARREAGAAPDTAKPVRAEVTSAMQDYIDLHRHAAVRAALLDHGDTALRLFVAHAIAGSHLFRLSPEPQSARNDGVRESVETCSGETRFDARRREVLGQVGFDPESPTVIDAGLAGEIGGDRVSAIFHRLLALSDPDLLAIIAVVMGEALARGSAAVETLGCHLEVAMADWWQADAALFDLIRDREVLVAMVAETAGEAAAHANAKEKAKALKSIIADSLAGAEGRAKVERWVPRWMTFPPAAYTGRGGVGSVQAAARAQAARPVAPDPDPEAPAPAVVPEEEKLAA